MKDMKYLAKILFFNDHSIIIEFLYFLCAESKNEFMQKRHFY